MPVVALKVDVDTDRGTRLGVPALTALFREFNAPACFLFSLGPDNTGKAIRRIFRPGFFQKVSRTSVVHIYGMRTLLNGTLLPAPHIGRRNEFAMRRVKEGGFEVGIHCHDHFRWQDYVLGMTLDEVREEFRQAREEFCRLFRDDALAAGAPSWQACAHSKQVYDEAGLLYASDTRGESPFFPRINGHIFNTVEIPSTLPTFDELMGRPEYPDDKIVAHYLSLLRDDRPNVFTLHAEIEGMGRMGLFWELMTVLAEHGVTFVRMDDLAKDILRNRAAIPVRDLVMAGIDGRSGLVATQGAA